MSIKKTKMLMTLVIDNSASTKVNVIKKLQSSLSAFDENIKNNHIDDVFEYNVISFQQFDAIEIKGFEDSRNPAAPLHASGLPMHHKAIPLALDKLKKRSNDLNSQIEYKSWLVYLMDGFNYDSIQNEVFMLLESLKKGDVNYFPFVTTERPLDSSLDGLQKIKRPLVIIDYKYDQLFSWLFETLKARLNTLPSDTFTLKPDSFDGWIRK